MLTHIHSLQRTQPQILKRKPVVGFHAGRESQLEKIRNILRGPVVQPQLKIGAPNDKYEQEADRVAEQVMRMPEPQVTASGGVIQRACTSCLEENKLEEGVVQTKPIMSLKPSSYQSSEFAQVPSIVHDILRSPGQPLDEQTRAFMEPRFGHDFSQVRVHTDAKAAESAWAVNAKAYTVGRDVVMGRGEYAPGRGNFFAPANRAAVPSVQTKMTVNKPGDKFEQEADRVAEQVMRMPEPQVQQQACSSPSCQKENEDNKILQTKSVDSAGSVQMVDNPLIQSVLFSPGQPLDAATRSFMEPRFGQDFSGVRVHTGQKAAKSSRSIHAEAYTVGHNVVFGAGQYAPETWSGKQLIAHELTHVVQQDGEGLRRTRIPAKEGAAVAGATLERGKRSWNLLSTDSENFSAGRNTRYQTRVIPAILHTSHLSVACQPDPENQPAGENTGGYVRILRLDNNVIAEIGRGNAVVANKLRQLAQNPNVRLEMNRGVYVETTRVTGDMLAVRKALIEKLNIQVVDEPIAQRVPTYERYAQSPDFPTHGQPKVTGGEAATLEDVPHIASAAAGGKDVELWSFDSRVQANARRLGVKIAPESNIAINKNAPDNHLNIIRLVPEVVSSDVKGPGSSGGGKGGGSTPPPAQAGGGQCPKGTGSGTSAIAQLPPLAESTKTRPASPSEIIARQKVIATIEAETAESLRFSNRLRVYGATFGALMNIYLVVNTVTDALHFSTYGTLYDEAQQNAKKLAAQSQQDLNDVTTMTGAISLLGAVQSVSDALERGDSEVLFDLSESLGNFESSFAELVDQMNDRHNRLEERLNALRVMEAYFDKLSRIPIDPMAGTIPQSQAFIVHESISMFMGPLHTASANYRAAATTLNFYVNYISGLAHEANKSAWILVLRRLKQMLKVAVPPGAARTLPQTPPPARQQQGPQLLPSPAPGRTEQSFQPLPGAPGPSPYREVEQRKAILANMAIDLIKLGNEVLSNSEATVKADEFKEKEKNWRQAVTILMKDYKKKGPDTGVSAMDELLNSDRYGGRLKEIRQTLGG
jgi:hypothetical protein